MTSGITNHLATVLRLLSGMASCFTKAGGLLGEPLKGAVRGIINRGTSLSLKSPLAPLFTRKGYAEGSPMPSASPSRRQSGECPQLLLISHDCRIGQTLVSPPAEPGVYLTELPKSRFQLVIHIIP